MNSRPSRIATWIAIVLAACAAPFVLALFLDPPEYTPSMDEGVMDVASLDGALYAKTIDSEVNSRVYVSRDSGETWNRTDALDMPEAVHDKLGIIPGQSEPHPVLCHPSTPEFCYSIVSVPNSECSKLEESRDGGQSWTLVSLPANLGSRHSFCPGSPYDIAFVPSSSAGTHSLVEAIGTSGILIRSPDGNWTHYGMDRFVQEMGAKGLSK